MQQTVPTVVDIVAEVVNSKPRAGVEWRTWRRRCHPGSLICIVSAPAPVVRRSFKDARIAATPSWRQQST
jgi:hypothetical protein